MRPCCFVPPFVERRNKRKDRLAKGKTNRSYKEGDALKRHLFAKEGEANSSNVRRGPSRLMLLV